LIDKYVNKVQLHNLTAIQKELLNDGHRFIVNAAGRRSRKTLIAKHKILADHFLNPEFTERAYYCLAPTFKQAKKLFWKDLKLFLRYIDINKSESELFIENKANGNIIFVEGLDRAERIEGVECHGLLISEIGNTKEHILYENILPMLTDTKGFGWFDGTPDYRNPFYLDLAIMAAGCKPPKAEIGKGYRLENPNNPDWIFYTWQSADVLDPKELEQMKSLYDPMIYKQEFEGEFIEAGGLVYYAFSFDNLKELEFSPVKHTVLCYDFNVDPMTVLVNQEIDADNWCVVKEFVLNNSNTEAATNHVIEWLQTNNFKGKLGVTGDFTGSARKTVGKEGSRSDWEIIRRLFAGKYGFERERISSVSHHLKDGINSLNALFKTADGNIRQWINRKECPYLYKDLTRQTLNKDGTLNDESGTIGHRSDALMYFAYNYYRIRREIEWV